MQQDDPNYERPPLKLDFRASADWGYRDDFNTQVVYMKKWQAMMRKDMKDLFANEVEPNVYEVNQFFWENNEMRKGSDMMHEVTAERILDERFHPDFMPLLTCLNGFPQTKGKIL